MEEQRENPALRIIAEVKKAVIGKDECIVKTMTAVLAGGNILLEDIPGVGKTTMALAFSRAMGLKENRIQFTPDVLPSDITGFSMYKKETGTFEYQPGAAMCNLLLADEINRTSPKTQSALLQVMEEQKVTVDGITRPLPNPFIVIATQNPVGSAGTQLLPESQLDRFMICMSMGYPDMEYELEIVKGKSRNDTAEKVEPVIGIGELLQMQERVREIFIHDALYRYIGELVQATRNHPMVELGVSPRGTIAAARMVQALAYLRGRSYVVPEDVTDIFADVTAHRIRLNSRARVNHVMARSVVEEILGRIPRPTVRRKQG